MERGALGGLNYRMDFPQQMGIPQQIPIGQGAPQEYQAPVVKDRLATRGGLTSDYYNSYAMLQSVVKDALSKGIDPFKPDFSQEGGGIAHQTFLKAQAVLMNTANALANELKAEEQVRGDLADGRTRLKQGVDMNSMWASNPNNFVPTAVDPIVTQANQELMQNRYTQRDSNNLNAAVRDSRIAHFQQLMQQDPQNAEYYNRQIQALLKNVPQAYAPDLNTGGSGAAKTPEIEILKKVTNLAQGVWPEGTFNVITKGGKALLENKSFAGEIMGEYLGQDTKGNQKKYQKIVKRWLKDPDTGTITIEFENPEVPNETVSGAKGDVIASALITNNPKYGDARKMYASARELGYLDDTSSAINEALIPQNADEIRNISSEFGKQQGAITSQKYNTAKNQLQKLKTPMFGNNTVVFTLPDGGVLEIGKHRGGDNKFYISNADELGLTSNKDQLTLDQAMQYLDAYSYFDQFLGQKPKSDLTQRQQKALEAFAKQFGRQPNQSERQKILNKYK